MHVAGDHVHLLLAEPLHIEPSDHSVDDSWAGDLEDLWVAVQQRCDMISTAEVPYAHVVVDLGAANAVAERLSQDVFQVDAGIREASPKRTDVAPEQEITIGEIDDPDVHIPKILDVLIVLV